MEKDDKKPPLGESMEADRPRTPRATVRQREKKLRDQLRELLRLDNEEQLRAALREEFAIEQDDPRFNAILQIWREQR
ncbi:MAG: hypothetical protein M3P27_08110 [Acidobacteriota bacterium]|nr:hypothetical protein [Acidobacteriota bacterium]